MLCRLNSLTFGASHAHKPTEKGKTREKRKRPRDGTKQLMHTRTPRSMLRSRLDLGIVRAGHGAQLAIVAARLPAVGGTKGILQGIGGVGHAGTGKRLAGRIHRVGEHGRRILPTKVRRLGGAPAVHHHHHHKQTHFCCLCLGNIAKIKKAVILDS